MKFYTLEQGKAVEQSKIAGWVVDLFGQKPRSFRTLIGDNIMVFTAFLGVDFCDGRAPLLWETGIVRKCQKEPEFRRQHNDFASALHGHIEEVERLCAEVGLCPKPETQQPKREPAKFATPGMRNACYSCKHRRPLGCTHHSFCNNAKAARAVGSQHGIDHGWFCWPHDFDPVWLVSCQGFELRNELEAN